MKRNLIPALAIAVFLAAGPSWAAGITSAAGFDTRVQTQVLLLNNQAAAMGDASMAQRLSAAFQVPTDVLLQERTTTGLAWSDIFLAHTIASNTRAGVSASQVLQMRSSGLTWNAISLNLGMPRTRLIHAAAIASRAMTQSSINGTGAEARFQRQTAFVNSAALSGGDQAVAQALSTQFGVSASALMQERTSFQAEWSDIFIAHTIQANTRTAVTTDQLLQMRASGMTWAQIGNAVQMSKTRLANALRIETREQANIQAAAGLGFQNRSFLNQQTQRNDQAMAQQLSTRFGISSSTLLQERTQFGLSWNDILLAHTLAQSSRTGVTAGQLLQLRASGMSWQQVSASAGITLNRRNLSVIRNANTETFVTIGSQTSVTGSTQTQTGTTSGSCGTAGTSGSARIKAGSHARVHGGMNDAAKLQASMKHAAKLQLKNAAKLQAGMKAARIQAGWKTTSKIRASQSVQLMKIAAATRASGRCK